MVEPNNVLVVLRTEKLGQLNDLYFKYRDENVNMFNRQKLLEMIKNICKELEIRLELDQEIVDSFKVYYRDTFKLKTFDEFCKIIIAWMRIHKLDYIPVVKTKQLYKEHLGNIKGYYQKYLRACKVEDKKLIESSIMIINSKLSLLNKPHYYELPIISFRQELFVKEIEALQEIFDFYANSNIIISKFTTFEGLKAQKKIWSCGILIKFLTVFGIYGKTLSKRHSISHKAVLDIFTKHSLLKKSLTFPGFLLSLEDISLEFYRNPENTPFVIDYQNLNPSYCRIALLDKIKILNIADIKETLKSSVKCFSNGDHISRITSDDPCLKYKFNIAPTLYDKLKQIKLEKCKKPKNKKMILSSSSNHLKIRTRPVSSYLSAKNSRKTFDVIKFADHTKSKASIEADIIIESID